MAQNLTATLMQELRAQYMPDTMDRNEIRPSVYGAYQFFRDQTNLPGAILTPETIALAKRSVGNTVKVPVLNKQNVQILDTVSCTIPADNDSSTLVTLTFVTLAWGFTMNRARHYNNAISYEQLWMQKQRMYLQKAAETLDTLGVNKLNTDRNIYFPANIDAYYPDVNNALQVTQAQKNDFFNNLQSIMFEMDYPTDINIIGSPQLQAMNRRLFAQGAGNAVNEAFQFTPYDWYYSNRVTNGEGIQSTLFAVPDGNVGFVNRNLPDNIMGHRIGDEKVWGLERMPIIDLEVGTYYTKDCRDMTAVYETGSGRMDHLARTMVEGFMFDTQVCFMTAYNSDKANTYSPIVKAEISLT